MKIARLVAFLVFISGLVCGYAAKANSGGYAIAEQSAFGVGQGKLNYINTKSSVKNNGLKSKNIHDDDFLPNLFANYHIPNSALSLGIGTYTPFGLATTYKENSFTRFAALRTELRTIYVTPGIAWQPSPYFSVGAGMSFVHSSAVLSRAIFLGAVGIGEGKLRITDTDDAYGYNVGLRVKPNDKLKFGITY